MAYIGDPIRETHDKAIFYRMVKTMWGRRERKTGVERRIIKSKIHIAIGALYDLLVAKFNGSKLLSSLQEAEVGEPNTSGDVNNGGHSPLRFYPNRLRS